MNLAPKVVVASARAAALAMATLVASPSSQAGRPVYTDYTLERLVREADVIAVVSLPAPHERTVRDAQGCLQMLWRLRVEEVLKKHSPQALGPAGAPEGEVDVLVNPTSLRDCTLRTQYSSGASFRALRYTPLGATAGPHGAPAGPRFLVFLAAQGGALQLAADGAWESLDRQPEVRRWIGQAAGTTR